MKVIYRFLCVIVLSLIDFELVWCYDFIFRLYEYFKFCINFFDIFVIYIFKCKKFNKEIGYIEKNIFLYENK